MPLVMVGHARYPAVDGARIASQSKVVVEGILRDELGFRGVVITDSTEAAAVLAVTQPAEAAIRNVRAGVDVVLDDRSRLVHPGLPQHCSPRRSATRPFARAFVSRPPRCSLSNGRWRSRAARFRRVRPLPIRSEVGDFENALLTWLPIIFFGVVIVLLVWTIRFMPRAKPAPVVKGSQVDVSWSDVAGLDEAKEELQEVVEFLRDRKRFERLGARVPRGILLHGPPGTGKTLLAKAVASASGANFYSQSASSFVEMFAGLGAARIRKLFEEARKNAPAIIFIDELDAVGTARAGGSVHREHDQTLEPAPRRARRLRHTGRGRGHGRLEPAAGPRSSASSPRTLRSSGPRVPARRLRP